MVDTPTGKDVPYRGSVHTFLALPEVSADAYVKVIYTGRADEHAWLWELRSWHALCQPAKSTTLPHILQKRAHTWRKLHDDLFPRAEGVIVQREGVHYKAVAKGPEELRRFAGEVFANTTMFLTVLFWAVKVPERVLDHRMRSAILLKALLNKVLAGCTISAHRLDQYGILMPSLSMSVNTQSMLNAEPWLDPAHPDAGWLRQVSANAKVLERFRGSCTRC